MNPTKGLPLPFEKKKRHIRQRRIKKKEIVKELRRKSKRTFWRTGSLWVLCLDAVSGQSQKSLVATAAKALAAKKSPKGASIWDGASFDDRV